MRTEGVTSMDLFLFRSIELTLVTIYWLKKKIDKNWLIQLKKSFLDKKMENLDYTFSVVSKVQKFCRIIDLKFGDGDGPNFCRVKK